MIAQSHYCVIKPGIIVSSWWENDDVLFHIITYCLEYLRNNPEKFHPTGSMTEVSKETDDPYLTVDYHHCHSSIFHRQISAAAAT